MSIKGVVFAVVLGLTTAAGCGPSSKDVQNARSAHYQTDRSKVFQASIDALERAGYQIAVADPDAGTLRTAMRIFDGEGGSVKTAWSDRDQLVSLELELHVITDTGGTRLEITPIGFESRPGYKRAPLKPSQPPMSSWIAGKVDRMYVAIHDTLKGHVVAGN